MRITVCEPGTRCSITEPTGTDPKSRVTVSATFDVPLPAPRPQPASARATAIALARAATLGVIGPAGLLDDLEQQLLAGVQLDRAHAQARRLAVHVEVPVIRALRLHAVDRGDEDPAHAGVVLPGPLAVGGSVERTRSTASGTLPLRGSALPDPAFFAVYDAIGQSLCPVLDL